MQTNPTARELADELTRKLAAGEPIHRSEVDAWHAAKEADRA